MKAKERRRPNARKTQRKESEKERIKLPDYQSRTGGVAEGRMEVVVVGKKWRVEDLEGGAFLCCSTGTSCGFTSEDESQVSALMSSVFAVRLVCRWLSCLLTRLRG